MKPDLSPDAILAALYRAPTRQRQSAMLAARRVLDGKPTALLVSQAEAARLLSISRVTVYRMVKDGMLHPVKLRGAVRYRLSELEQLANGEALTSVVPKQ